MFGRAADVFRLKDWSCCQKQGPTVSACAIGKATGGENWTNDVIVRPVFTLLSIIYPEIFDLNHVRDHN